MVLVDGMQTHKGTLELAGRIGRTPWKLLVDSGLTRNYISTRVCTVHNLKVKEDRTPDRLTMANGSTPQMKGKVQVVFKYGGYWRIIEAKIFPGLQKPVVLGIPWLTILNIHIDWISGAIVVKKRSEWIQLPIAYKSGPSEETVAMVNAK